MRHEIPTSAAYLRIFLDAKVALLADFYYFCARKMRRHLLFNKNRLKKQCT